MITNSKEMMSYLISESVMESKPTILKNTSLDTVIIDTQLQDSSEFNRNVRNYPKNVLDTGLNHPTIKELISRKSWVGEAGHPINPTLQRQMTVLNSNLSHRILSWRWDNQIVRGIVETLLTDRGKEMRDLIRQELETAFSLRAVGPVKKTERGDIVQSPLSIVCYDWVFVPSHKGSYQLAILKGGGTSSTLSESYCIALQESADYIAEYSENFRLVCESMEFKASEIILSEDLKTIQAIDNSRKNDKLILSVEDCLSTEIRSYMNKFR